MSPPTPSRAELARLVALCMGRGLPAADAEDTVARAYERAAAAYDPRRGAFGALLQRVVQREAIEWWRTHLRRPEARDGALAVVAAPPSGAALEAACANQRRLLDALEPAERAVFAAWALQKVHSRRGRRRGGRPPRPVRPRLRQRQAAPQGPHPEPGVALGPRAPRLLQRHPEATKGRGSREASCG
ncbi:MAG: hypothetical protein R3F59_01935 [Myxococcota bacterium]